MYERVSILLLLAVDGLRGDVNVMKDVTLGFGKALEKCREESQLTEETLARFFDFWRDDFKSADRELGCTILCMSHHFNNLTASSRKHHEYQLEFSKSFRKGVVMTVQIMDIVHGCTQLINGEPDHCWRVLRQA